MKNKLLYKLNMVLIVLALCAGLFASPLLAEPEDETTSGPTETLEETSPSEESSSEEETDPPEPTEAAVPNVVGLTEPEARQILAEAGFTNVRTQETETEDANEIGKVIRVSPAADTVISLGEEIVIDVGIEKTTEPPTEPPTEAPKRYSISVTDGTASASSATEGEEVTITLSTSVSYREFGYWIVEDGSGISEWRSQNFSFRMPASDVKITLQKKYALQVEGGKAESEGESSSLLYVFPGKKVTVKPHASSQKGFFAWLITGLKQADSSYDEEFTFTMPENAVSLQIQYGGTVTVTYGLGTVFPEKAQEKTEVTVSQPQIPEGQVFDAWEIEGVKGLTRSDSEVFTFSMPPNDVRITLHTIEAETPTTEAAPGGYYHIDRYRIHKSLNGTETPEGFEPASDSGTFTENVEAFYSQDYKIYVYYADRGTDDSADLYVYDPYDSTLILYSHFQSEDGKDFIVTTPGSQAEVPGKFQSKAKIHVASYGTDRIMAPGFVTVTEKNQQVNVVYLCDAFGKRDFYVVTSEDGAISLEQYDEYVRTHEAETEPTESEEPSSEEDTTEEITTEEPTEPTQPEKKKNPYLFWIILVSVLLLLVIIAIILVIYFNRKQEDEEQETDLESDDPKEAFEVFNRVKERDRADSDYNPNSLPDVDFNTSFENAFPAEMGIAAAVREIDDEEDMSKRFTNDYPMGDIEDITEELVNKAPAEILAQDTQRIELLSQDTQRIEIPQEDIDEAEKAAEFAANTEGLPAAQIDTDLNTAVTENAADAFETPENAADQFAVSEDAADAFAVSEDAADAFTPSEDAENVFAAPEEWASLFAAEAVTKPAAEEIADVTGEIGETDPGTDPETETEAKPETDPDTVAETESETSAETEEEKPVVEDPAIERLKAHLSGGIKSDEEIAQGRSLKKVTYKDILLEEDFEEIDFGKNSSQEKKS